MKITSTIRTALLATTLCFAWLNMVAQGSGDYPVNFATDATSTHGSRYPGKITVTTSRGTSEQSWGATAVHHVMYKDFTESFVVEVVPGSQFTIAYAGGSENWMHFYAYLDYGQDGQFSYTTDETNHRAVAGSDLVAWSFYSYGGADTSGWNSAGTPLSGDAERNTKVLPGSIQAPLVAGDYRVRAKLDWNSIDPGGSSGIAGNGGAIMDFTLRVTSSAYALSLEGEDGTAYANAKVATASSTLVGGATVGVPTGTVPTGFLDEYWQCLNLVGYRVGDTIYDTWEEVTAAVSAPDSVTAIVTPTSENLHTGHYYALRHEQVGTGETVGQIRYAYANGTVLNADMIESPALGSDVDHVFRVEQAAGGKFYLYDLSTNLYAQRPGAVGLDVNIPTSAEATPANNAYFITNGIFSGRPEVFALADGVAISDPLGQVSEKYYLHNSSNEKVVRWSTVRDAESNSQWYFEELSIPVVTVTFTLDGNEVTPPFTAAGSDNTLIAQRKVLAWATDIIPGASYEAIGWNLNGISYNTREEFFEAMHTLTMDGEATIAVGHRDYFPAAGNSYFIAAQTWDGLMWIERLLVNSNESTLGQTLDLNAASAWTVEEGSNFDEVRLKSPLGKYIMYGGISSAAQNVLVRTPTDWTSGQHAKSLTIYSKAGGSGDWRFVLARNNGENFASGDKSTAETGYKPKDSAYTPYYRFYDATQQYFIVRENEQSVATYFLDGEEIAADILLSLDDVKGKTLSVNHSSYNTQLLQFEGFYIGNTRVGEGDTYVIPEDVTGHLQISAHYTWRAACDTYGENWLTIRNNNLGTYAAVYDDNDTKRIKPMAYAEGDAYKWCFVKAGDGFYIYNKEVGDGMVVTLDAAAADGTSISMKPKSDTNPERQIWTLVNNGTSKAIVMNDNTGLGWNPYGDDTNPLKLFDASGVKSRWQLIESGRSLYYDREGNSIMDGAIYTFISAYENYYNRQKKLKGIYLNSSDNKLYWKDYTPNDDAFYFKAHVTGGGTVTMECMGKPGYYLTGAATAVAETGNAFTVNNLSSGMSNIYVNGGASFHTNNHSSGGGAGSNIIAYNGGTGSASAWYIQRADDKDLEVARYQQELADRQAAIDEAARLAKREELRAAIESCRVGYEFGQYPQKSVDAAWEVYNDDTKTLQEYADAIVALRRTINPPQMNTYFQMKTAFAWNDGEPRVMAVGKGKVLRWEREKESLFQLWRVAAVDENDHSCIALLNMGSGTYMKSYQMNAATTTTTEPSFVRLTGAEGNAFYIETLSSSGNDKRFHTGSHGNGASAEGDIMPYDGGRNTWLLEEMSEMDMSALAYDEDNRIQARADLLERIGEVKRMTTTNGAIGYYNTLGTAIAAAQTVYDNETNTKGEYQDAIAALQAAYDAATPIRPEAGQTYVLMGVADSRVVVMESPEAEEEGERINISEYDDTDAAQFWTIAHSEGNQYVFTNGGVSVTLTITPVGNDQYDVDGLSIILGNCIIKRGSVATDHNYLTNGVYRLVNVANGKALANNGTLVARTMTADKDETCTDHLQLWTIEKKSGADRYTLQNVETNRYLDQPTINANEQVGTAPHHAVWHLIAGSEEGQYQLVTTEGLNQQLCMVGSTNPPTLKVAGTSGDLWTFEAVTPQEKPVVRYPAVRIKNFGKANSYMSAVDYTAEQKALTAVDNPMKAMWVLVPHDFELTDGTTETRYGIRNAYSGLYMQNLTKNNEVLGAGTTPVYYTKSAPNADKDGAVAFKSPNNFYMNAHGGNTTIVGWNEADKNSHWYLEDVMVDGEQLTFTEEELMVKADTYEGYCAPRDGLICRIYNPNRGTYLDEDYNALGPRHGGLNTAKYTQLWLLHYDEAEAMYTIENLYTGDYLRNQPSFNVQYLMTDDMATAGTFTLACNPTIVGQRIYNIIDSRSGRYVHAQSTGLCVTWTAGSNSISASEWRFKPVDVTDEQIEAMHAKYAENKNMTQNVGKYQGILDQIFEDKACTTIKSELTDEELTELVDQLPDLLANMVNKIKDNTWTAYESGRNWEKAFRISTHGVMSNHSAMSGLVAVDYGFSRLNDPTGIKAQANEVVALMVDNDIPSGSQLKVESQNGFGMSGGQYILKKGLNLIPMETESNLFIYYMINSGADDPANYISNYPDIKIHIEGGEVFGKLDRTRVFEVEKTTDGETTTEVYDMRSHHAWSEEAAAARDKADELWVNMQADGLLANGYMTQVKSECILFNFASSEFLRACPVNIGGVTDIWDWMMKSEQFILGMRNNWTLPGQNGEFIDTYIPNFSKRFNNIYMATERTGGYMNAVGYGAMYTVGTAASILNFNNLKSGGAIWGPAHEHGHDHQKLINMIGMSEVSNNLFSNVANYYHGTLVSRGGSLPDVMNNYVAGRHWFDLSIWNMTQMYYKLFLYYHAAHNKDDFYPLVFKKLRNGERIRRVQGTAVGAHEDYLRFALVCSEVAGEDLSEFFEAYGMFREISPEVSNYEPVEKNGKQCRYVGDYGDFYVYTDMDKVAEIKAKIQACGPRNSVVLFAEDRVSREPATNPFSNLGDMKANRGDGGVVGAYGNIGQYTDMDKNNPDYDEEKTTGYLIYDEDGGLLYFTATDNGNGEPVIPQSVVEAAGGADNLVVAEVESNGDVIEQADPETEVFTITTYIYDKEGNRQEKTQNSAGRMKPVLAPNEVMVVSARDMSQAAEARVIFSRDRQTAVRRLAGEMPTYRFADDDNVIMRDEDGHLTMHSLAVTDKQPLYLPIGSDDNGPLTENITYSRTNTAGWNSVCLPFATTAEDFGEGSQIYTLRAQDSSTITLSPIDRAEAGEPCYVFCPNTVTSWIIERPLNDYTTTELVVKVADDVQLKGSFENTTIGAGKYKMNPLGTQFGITSAKATVTAFRSYIEGEEGSQLTARSFVLRIENNDADGLQTVVRDMQPDVMYDLNGNRVKRAIPGKPYIINGKVNVSK